MMPKLGLIIGDVCQLGEALKNARDHEVETEHGPVSLKLTDKWAVVCRGGFRENRLPHEYTTAANLAALGHLGLREIIGVHSSGSLRPSLAPGTLVVPDDWIDLAPVPRPATIHSRRHLTPSFSRRVRQNLADAAWKAQVRFENGGVYWQTCGPRLETKAEIKVMSNFADLVGMGMATEADLAQEMGLEYGAVCSVDNYANGLGSPLLTDEMIREQSVRSGAVILRVLDEYPAVEETLF
jgi:5'-methylthioadenosine phosphorylase